VKQAIGGGAGGGAGGGVSRSGERRSLGCTGIRLFVHVWNDDSHSRHLIPGHITGND
jgi:hypothetical protein